MVGDSLRGVCCVLMDSSTAFGYPFLDGLVELQNSLLRLHLTLDLPGTLQWAPISVGRNVAVASLCPIVENNNKQQWAGERRLRKASLPPTAKPCEGWRHCTVISGLDWESRRHDLRGGRWPCWWEFGMTFPTRRCHANQWRMHRTKSHVF